MKENSILKNKRVIIKLMIKISKEFLKLYLFRELIRILNIFKNFKERNNTIVVIKKVNM